MITHIPACIYHTHQGIYTMCTRIHVALHTYVLTYTRIYIREYDIRTYISVFPRQKLKGGGVWWLALLGAWLSSFLG